LRAKKKYSDKGLTVLWIGFQDRIEKLSPFAKRYGIPDYLFDPDNSMSRKYGMTYGAGIVFINSDGIVKSRIPKGFSPATLETEVKKIL
jgi:cytochrome oxidase Cu insertion factor (SCO1/SenC/PrrC family)